MKNKHLLLLFFIAMIIVIIGALFKIMHWPFASMILAVGLLSEVIVVFLLILKIANNNNSDFLNK